MVFCSEAQFLGKFIGLLDRASQVEAGCTAGGMFLLALLKTIVYLKMDVEYKEAVLYQCNQQDCVG